MIKIVGSNFLLSEKGKELFKHLKPKKDLIEVLEDFKSFLNDLTDDEVLTFVYVNYPNYIEESVKWEGLKPKRVNVALSLLRKNKISFNKALQISGLGAKEFEKIILAKEIKWK